MILATTFSQDGELLAHELGNAHPHYTPDDTRAMWDRKVKERAEHGLGWPGCQAFEDAGCKFCKDCPHYGEIKSPLNLALSSAQLDETSGIGQDKKDETSGIGMDKWSESNPAERLMKLRDQGANSIN